VAQVRYGEIPFLMSASQALLLSYDGLPTVKLIKEKQLANGCRMGQLLF